MKIIFKIAKNELRHVFYSPIAWFVMIVFLVQCAVYFAGPLYNVANWQEIMLKNSPGFKGDQALTFGIFIRGGVFFNVVNNLYLFIPVLTMGLISREVSNGSVKLLYSSPVSLWQIVCGKYLGIMLYNVLLVFILGFFMLIGVIDIRHVDYGMLLSAALGLYLLICAYSAMGLFMSSLSTYQIVSALSTFVLIFVLSRIGELWQRYDLVRDLTYFLSLQNRVFKMLGGLIVTRDVIYFVLVAAMFVGFTLIKLKAGREAKPWYIKLGRYMTVSLVVLLLGYISSRPVLTAYFDTTATQFNTIPKEMQQLISDMGDSTLEVTLYTNLLGAGRERGLPEARNADYMVNMWEPYLRFKPKMVFKYEYYYDINPQNFDSLTYKDLKEMAGYKADEIDAGLSMFKSPEEMRRTINLEPEGYRLVMQVKYRGRTAWLRTYDDSFFWPDLNNVSAAFKRLLKPDKIPKVFFMTGALERNIYKTGAREYALHTAAKASRGALVNTGYDADTLNLEMQDIPTDISALVLADPKMELSNSVQGKLQQYVQNGGNLFISGEPGKQYVLNPFLKQLGVLLIDGQLVEPTYDETPDKIVPFMTAYTSKLQKELSWIGASLTSKKDTLKILMPGATGLSYTEDSSFRVKPLLTTVPDRVWLKKGDIVIDSTLPPFNPEEGDFKASSFSTTVQLTRTVIDKEQRIVVCGDADFASNMRLPAYLNSYFLMPVYSWLTYNEFPVSMTHISPKDLLLRVGATNAYVQKIVYVWVLPGMLLLAGTILLIRRKNK